MDEAKRQRRNDYQRELMRRRRARIAKALALAELTSGKLKGTERTERVKSLQSVWAAAREAFIIEAQAVTLAEIHGASRQFWQTLDTRLDTNLKAAKDGRA
jgi:hypothetical protein